MPFDNIFGDKMRLVIPFTGSSDYDELKNQLSKINGFVSFDPVKKEVVRKVKIKKPTGEKDTKDQKLNLGKAISTLKISDEQKKELLNWFSTYSKNIAELETLDKYSIVLSRFPIDVLRMGDMIKQDGDRIGHCHRPGGEYFGCAIQEARTGGPIAYLVLTKDLTPDIMEKINTDEIFKDNDRNIRGIRVVARLRVRHYRDKINKTSYAIPEKNVYGETVSGFAEKVTKFLQEKQPDIINNKNDILSRFNDTEIIKKGGTYNDTTTDGALFNRFFNDTNAFPNTIIPHSKQDALAEPRTEDLDDYKAEEMENDLRQYQNRYANNLQHSSVYYDVEHTVSPYYMCGGSMEIDISPIDISLLNFPDDMSDREDFGYILNYHSNRSNWQNSRLSPEEKRTRRIYSKFLKIFLDGAKIDKATICGLHPYKDDTKMLLSFWLGIYHETEYDTSMFRSLCRSVAIYDDQYEEIRQSLITALSLSRLIDSPTIHGSENSNFEKFENGTLKGMIFFTEYNDEGFAGDGVVTISPNTTHLTASTIKQIEIKIINKLVQLYTQYITSKQTEVVQLGFKNFAESTQMTNFGQEVEVEVKIKQNQDPLYNIHIELTTTEYSNPHFVNFVLYLDGYFKSFLNTFVKGLILDDIPTDALSPQQQKEKTFLAKYID